MRIRLGPPAMPDFRFARRLVRRSPFTVGLDFDGTVVVPDYPRIGEELPLAVGVLRLLLDRGARLVLWTVRPSGPMLDGAVAWFAARSLQLAGVGRIDQAGGTWPASDSPKPCCDVFVDDRALGAPLQRLPGREPMLDWSIAGPLLLARHEEWLRRG